MEKGKPEALWADTRGRNQARADAKRDLGRRRGKKIRLGDPLTGWQVGREMGR